MLTFFKWGTVLLVGGMGLLRVRRYLIMLIEALLRASGGYK